MVRFALICVYGVVAVYITEVGGDIARKIETTDNPHTGGDWRDRFTDDELEELGRMGVNVDGTYARYGGPTKEQRQAILAAQRLRGLRERFNSGRLSDDDKRELQRLRKIRGASDVDEQIRELNKNRDQLDAQSRAAVDLWNSLRVADDGSGKESEE